MRLLITGAQGMMGQDLQRLARESGHEAHATDIERLVDDPEDRLDVTEPAALRISIERARPDALIHLAAMTNVDGCERDPERAYRVNTVGTENIALQCRELDIPLMYISTGSVFRGDKTEPYHEFDLPDPVSVYSRSKWAGEEIVRSLLPRHYIVRAGWMFGGGPQDKKFVAKMIDRARQDGRLRAVDDKFGSPTFTADISRRCLELIEAGRFGTYHAANEGWCSRFEMAQAIVEFAGIGGCVVEPCSSVEFPLPAPRPRMEALDGLHARLIGLTSMRPWREALGDYVRTTLVASR